jgi:Protein of unknown function (DUF3038)
MPVQSPPVESPLSPLLDKLPTPDLAQNECPRRAKMQLDFIMLAIEALDLAGSEAMLVAAKDLGLDPIIKGRVNLWTLRSTNPLRKFNQRRPLSLEEGKAMVLITCYLARHLTVLLRQLLLGYQQLQDKDLSWEHHFRLAHYLNRFRTHFRARMNPNRSAIISYHSDESINELALSLLAKLLFCTGTQGEQRFWNSLFDGEVA